MADKIFVNGLISQEVSETTPDFILGKLSLKVDDLIKFLQENQKYAVSGYLNATILRSKSTQKRYIELDLFQYNKLNIGQAVSTQGSTNIAKPDYPADDKFDEIPF